MKFTNFKKMLLPFVAAAFLNSCDKPETTDQLADNGQQIIKIVGYGGLDNFSNSLLVLDASTTSALVECQLEFSTSQVSANDITVTLAVDPTGVDRYNATLPDPNVGSYALLDPIAYTFPSTTVLIKAGKVLSEPFFVEFDPSKIDPSINLMLPVTITSISGAASNVKAAPGTGTAYFHFIGNPLAGNYDVVGTRYNYVGAVSWDGPPNPLPAGGSPSAIPPVKFALPLDGQTVQLDFAALGAGVLNYEYFITGSSDFSSISIDFSSALLAASSSRHVYLSGYVAPGPGIKPEFHIITHYNNTIDGTGNDRIIDEYFKHQ